MAQQRISTPPAAHGAGVSARPPEVADLLDRVRQLLAEERASEALRAVEESGLRSARADNARAVCLMRAGRAGAAVDLLRGLVFDPTGLAVRADTDPVIQANYATALLLDGNSDGFRGILGGIRDRQHPAVTRLAEAVRRWEAGLSWGEWLGSFVGARVRPFTLDFPPGEL